ncbi:hypothetical protein TIFTF001_004535 [Ficus carica]|uniref:Uncharacterized protein n=1 Tax=Ficus carica TaxID=3494 RepID=A0AA87ZDB1_FICCA|nr:hypothetical protein TIFTF001_004535 [Ficus carica]
MSSSYAESSISASARTAAKFGNQQMAENIEGISCRAITSRDREFINMPPFTATWSVSSGSSDTSPHGHPQKLRDLPRYGLRKVISCRCRTEEISDRLLHGREISAADLLRGHAATGVRSVKERKGERVM